MRWEERERARASEQAGEQGQVCDARTGVAGTLRCVIIRVSELSQVFWVMMLPVMMIMVMRKDDRLKK